MSYRWVSLQGSPDIYNPGRRHAPSVTVDPDDWAHGVWTALAVTLAEPLRRTLSVHWDGCEVCQTGHMLRCPTGLRLFNLLPAGDRILIA